VNDALNHVLCAHPSVELLGLTTPSLLTKLTPLT